MFVHGAYVTGALWDDVVARMSPGHRCIVPTWPFGAQVRPVGDVDLRVMASAKRVVGLLEALDLHDVTLVANDTGGGIVLAALGDSSLDFSRVGRLVFTNCDSFEHFPPRPFVPLVKLYRHSQRLGSAMLHGLATRPGQTLFASSVTKAGIDPARRAAIFGGFITSSAVRMEAARFTADLQPCYTLTAVNAMQAWPTPVLMAWGNDDSMFPLAHATGSQAHFPTAACDPLRAVRPT